MPLHETNSTAGGQTGPRRLRFLNAGFLWQRRVRRIMALAGWEMRPGWPKGPEEFVAVWGRSPYAARGERAADHAGVPLVRIEDAFLRSLHPGRHGEPPIGLMIDPTGGVHFDASQPSALETILAQDPLDATDLLDPARGGMARMAEADLSKYSGYDSATPLPAPGYILVIDQTRGDASVRASGADRNTFREMLYWAREENPGRPILLKTHPETAKGLREGYYGAHDVVDGVTLFSDPVSPRALLEGAWAVYTVSSQMGFEAILAGHRPQVFGTPFYAGWGLSDDRGTIPLIRRGRALTRAQLFAGAMILAPTWYDPYRDRLATFEDALEAMAAEARAWREDHRGWTASGMRAWKRRPLQKMFGRWKPMRFGGPRADRPAMVWGLKEAAPGVARLEDGFLRSRGLGADLVPPLSLILDRSGVYFDPSAPSDLEGWIAKRAVLRPDQTRRAEALIRAILRAGVSKYNLGAGPAQIALPEGRRILVPGQVEDDASIIYGAGEIRSNIKLLEAVRAANPEAVVIYKPHPDVMAGLRRGAIDAQGLADVVLSQGDIAAVLDAVDEVWTMTSLTGFEALLRGKRVVTLGAPFYAGWGLTRHLGPALPRREARPSLAGLAHAALIDAPRYLDPITMRPCSAEVAVERLASGVAMPRGVGLRGLAKLQGWGAGYAHWWR